MRGHEKRSEKYPENKYKEASSQKKSSAKPDIIRRDTGPSKATRGDEWHDPWQRYCISPARMFYMQKY